MCGINGFNWNNEELILKMNKAIKHRGPDDDGIYTDSGLSLGNVRLSILDLSDKGHQPMSSADNSVWVVYNGELYNFPRMRKELEDKGRIFISATDTEVILHKYSDMGIECLKEFNGIFAFCLYDSLKKVLYLVRDRLGIKPLYYLHDGEKFIFSSEPKAFEVHKNLKFTIDQDRVSEYFDSQNITDESIFREIRALQPGTYLKLDLATGRIFVERYVDIYKEINNGVYLRNRNAGEAKAADELDELLHTVIKDQLLSDAPLGTICSGGIDSSLVTAIASKYKKNVKILTVTVDAKKYDETRYAEKVARHLGLELITERLTREKYISLVEDCIRFEDLPLSHPNSIGIYLIAKKAKDEALSVLLTGEGADELFGGYHWYRSFYKLSFARSVPLAGRLFKNMKIPAAPSLGTAVEEVKRIDDLLYFLPDGIERNTMSYIIKDLNYYLVPILRRTDRMSMGAGVEMRVPYLDNRLIKFAMNLPLEYKLNWGQGKILLKKVAERYLPRDIIYRKKMGFPLPINEWLGTDNFKSYMYSKWKSIVSR